MSKLRHSKIQGVLRGNEFLESEMYLTETRSVHIFEQESMKDFCF